MPDHKFEYTVSGVQLSKEQQFAISQEIGVAIARVLMGASPAAVQSNFLNICKIHGGKWIPVDEAADETVGEVVASAPG